MDPPEGPVHLVECHTVQQVQAWLTRHSRDWHHGQVLTECGLCQLAQAKLAVLTGRPKAIA